MTAQTRGWAFARDLNFLQEGGEADANWLKVAKKHQKKVTVTAQFIKVGIEFGSGCRRRKRRIRGFLPPRRDECQREATNKGTGRTALEALWLMG